jgi:hypothetical protein
VSVQSIVFVSPAVLRWRKDERAGRGVETDCVGAVGGWPFERDERAQRAVFGGWPSPSWVISAAAGAGKIATGSFTAVGRPFVVISGHRLADTGNRPGTSGGSDHAELGK